MAIDPMSSHEHGGYAPGEQYEAWFVVPNSPAIARTTRMSADDANSMRQRLQSEHGLRHVGMQLAGEHERMQVERLYAVTPIDPLDELGPAYVVMFVLHGVLFFVTPRSGSEAQRLYRWLVSDLGVLTLWICMIPVEQTRQRLEMDIAWWRRDAVELEDHVRGTAGEHFEQNISEAWQYASALEAELQLLAA